MSYPLCRHIKTTGLQCQSPALLGNRFCYYHVRLASRHSNYRPNRALDPFFEPGQHIRLNALEDRASIQMAISQTVNAIATGQIELKRAKAILYGLQLAAQSIKELEAHPELAPDPKSMVQSIVPSPDHLDLAPPDPNALPQTPEGKTLEGKTEEDYEDDDEDELPYTSKPSPPTSIRDYLADGFSVHQTVRHSKLEHP